MWRVDERGGCGVEDGRGDLVLTLGPFRKTDFGCTGANLENTLEANRGFRTPTMTMMDENIRPNETLHSSDWITEMLESSVKFFSKVELGLVVRRLSLGLFIGSSVVFWGQKCRKNGTRGRVRALDAVSVSSHIEQDLGSEV
jgi:hypothetical protein